MRGDPEILACVILAKLGQDYPPVKEDIFSKEKKMKKKSDFDAFIYLLCPIIFSNVKLQQSWLELLRQF